MPIDTDGAMGLAGTMIGAAVAITAVKMTTDMVSGVAVKKRCIKCKKVKSKCKCKANMDYGGDLFKVDNWRNL